MSDSPPVEAGTDIPPDLPSIGEVWDAAGDRAAAVHAASEARVAAAEVRADFMVERSSATVGSVVTADYADINQLGTMMRAFHDEVAPTIAWTAAILVDPDLVASMPLSPFTGLQVQAAATASAVGLGSVLAVNEGLTAVIVSVASTYEIADTALQAAVPILGAGADYAGVWIGGTAEAAWADVRSVVEPAVAFADAAGNAAVAVVGLGYVVEATVALEFLTVTGRAIMALNNAATTAADDGWAWALLAPGGGLIFAGATLAYAPQAFASTFTPQTMASALWANVQRGIGLTGPAYDVILGSTIRAGQRAGLFTDDTAHRLNDLDLAGIATTERNTAQFSAGNLGREEFTTDGVKIIPTDGGALFASLDQLDKVGLSNMADIRVVTVYSAVNRPGIAGGRC